MRLTDSFERSVEAGHAPTVLGPDENDIRAAHAPVLHLIQLWQSYFGPTQSAESSLSPLSASVPSSTPSSSSASAGHAGIQAESFDRDDGKEGWAGEDVAVVHKFIFLSQTEERKHFVFILDSRERYISVEDNTRFDLRYCTAVEALHMFAEWLGAHAQPGAHDIIMAILDDVDKALPKQSRNIQALISPSLELSGS